MARLAWLLAMVTALISGCAGGTTSTSDNEVSPLEPGATTGSGRLSRGDLAGAQTPAQPPRITSTLLPRESSMPSGWCVSSIMFPSGS